MDAPRTPPPSDAPPAAPGGANPGYALGELARALATAADHPDAATRARADERAATWLGVADAARFLQQYGPGFGDYTAECDALLGDIGVEGVLRLAEEHNRTQDA